MRESSYLARHPSRRQASSPTALKRYDHTNLLISTFGENGYDSAVGRAAICRMKRTVDPLLTMEQRNGNRGHGREPAGTKAAQEEGIG